MIKRFICWVWGHDLKLGPWKIRLTYEEFPLSDDDLMICRRCGERFIV